MVVFGRHRHPLHLGALHFGEAFVISVPVEEEHDARDVVVHAAPAVALGDLQELLYANAVVLRRALQDTLWAPAREKNKRVATR